MDSKANGNEAAFPRPLSQVELGRTIETADSFDGLTKRELFAVAAMIGLLSSEEAGNDNAQRSPDLVSKLAVSQADSLLAELSKVKP